MENKLHRIYTVLLIQILLYFNAWIKYYFTGNKMSLARQTIPKRIILYPRDIENLTGRKGRTARAILQKIREHFGKPKNAPVSIREFCSFMCLDEMEVRENLH